MHNIIDLNFILWWSFSHCRIISLPLFCFHYNNISIFSKKKQQKTTKNNIHKTKTKCSDKLLLFALAPTSLICAACFQVLKNHDLNF